MYTKKLFLVFAFMGIIGAQAQTYVGASMWYHFWTTESGSDSNIDAIWFFSFSPEIGRCVNDRLEIGLDLGLEFGNGYTASTTIHDVPIGYSKMYSIAPYVRYALFASGKWKIFEQFSILGGLGDGTSQKSKGEIKQWKISLIPMLSYDFSSKISLVSRFDILGIDYGQYTIGNYTSTEFNFSAKLNSIVPSIGVLYRF